MDHLSYMPGLLELLTRSHRFVADWVRIFFATLWVPRDRAFIQFMFNRESYQLTQEQIAEALGVPLVRQRVHELCYLSAYAPRRALARGTVPPIDIVSVIFRQPFSPDSLRTLEELTPLATTLLLAFRKSLYPRAGFREGITVMQQWLLALVLGHTQFDIVDLLICEWEDWIADGFKGKRRMPYSHIICYLLAKSIDFPRHIQTLEASQVD